jgi:hypothetical protein
LLKLCVLRVNTTISLGRGALQMPENIAKSEDLKTALENLNRQCQLARDNELRYAVQRSRLEAERAVVLAEAVAALQDKASEPSGPASQIGPVTAQQNGYRISIAAAKMPLLRLPPLPSSAEVSTPSIPAKSCKPAGLPSVAKMIVAVLEDAAKDGYHGLRPCDLAEVVRKTWWRDVQTKVVNTTAWQMARDGKLAKDGALYKLNGHE